MMDEYEESFYYDKPSSTGTDAAGQAVGAGLGLGAGLIGTILGGLLFLISRIDLFSSGILALLFYMLTYKNGWTAQIYIIAAIAIVVVSMLLQHKFKVARIMYGIFTCIIASIIGPICIGYDSEVRLYVTIAICFGITVIWEFLSWKFILNK